MGRVVTREVLRFMQECLKAVGAPAQAAQQQAELLLRADMMEHYSHGLNRLEYYVKDIKTGACQPVNKPKLVRETQATALVDGNNAMGATISHFGMDLAVQKAANAGVGWVSVKGSNHNGMLGFWAEKAAKKGFIGIAMTNTSPLLAPTRSKQSALGTNPLSVVAPGNNGELFYLDMATTAVALGKIEMQRRKGEPIPDGWAQGPDGQETNDAELAFHTACMRPLGGGELTSGYKGYGLAAVVDLFCGMLSGSLYGHHIRPWASSVAPSAADLGHCFVAVDPGCFAEGFADRLTDSMQFWRNLEPTDPNLPVLAPGDKERKRLEESEKRGTITYVKQQIDSCASLAKSLEVEPLKVEC